MAKRVLSVLCSTLENIATGATNVISGEANLRYFYVDGKKTETPDAVILVSMSRDIGEFQIVFPPIPTLVDELNTKYPFGESLTLPELGEVADVKIGTYNGGLQIKFLMERKTNS